MAILTYNNVLFDTDAIRNAGGLNIAIVTTDWNEKIVEELWAGCQRILSQFPVRFTHSMKVPGAVELTHACAAIMNQTKHKTDVIIALGAVIRGGTPHFDYVCQSVVQGITSLNAQGKIPIIFGVLTLDNEAQAWERLGGTHGHKGEESAYAALKMALMNLDLRRM